MRARVGIVDNHPAVILGVTAALNAQGSMLVTGTGSTVRELMEQAGRFQTASFDVVLIDVSLADGSTPNENLRALEPTGAAVLIYSSGDQSALLRAAARAGAIGMVRKSAQTGTLIAAVEAAARGERVISAEWIAALEPDTDAVQSVLSDREVEVLALYAAGETAERVGEQLFISRETVLDHIRRIRTKYAALGRPARTKVDLYRRAVEDGIITLGGMRAE